MTVFLFSGLAMAGFFLMFSEEEVIEIRRLGLTLFLTSLLGIYIIWV